MTEQDNLIQDLENHIDNKLMLWTTDSMELFIMADLEGFAYRSIFKCLLRNICAGLVECKADDELATRLFLAYLNRARATKAKKRAQGLG